MVVDAPTTTEAATRLAKALAALPAQPRGFVLALLSDPSQNATAAYKAAGYKARGRAAESGASRLLSSAKVREAIAAAQAPVAEKLGVTVERIEREWARIAFATMRDVAEWGQGRFALLDSATLSEDTAAAIAEVGTETRFEAGLTPEDATAEVRKQKIKLHDKTTALRELGKRHGFYVRPNTGKRRGLTRDLVDDIRRKILGIDEPDGDDQ